VNTGEGPFLQALRQAASLVVLQWNRGDWAKDDETLRNADAVEIQLGQGARGGVGTIHKAQSLDETLHAALGIPQNDDAVSHSFPPGADSIEDLPGLVTRIREATGGVPVGVKFAATQRLERDLEALVRAGVDFVTICGAQGGTWGTPPALEDDFGLPTVYALARAGRFFRQRGLKGKVSLVADGGFYAPGDFLKAVALGADAVSIGTIALFALGHDQVLAALPWEPATQLVYYGGKYTAKLDVPKAARNLSNFLLSCRLEMMECLRALGKSSLAEVALKDLIAMDRETADFTGAVFGGVPPKPRKVRAVKRRRNDTSTGASSVNEAPERAEPVPIGAWRRPGHEG
jgi:glutamate synthase domain-containing protein 2